MLGFDSRWRYQDYGLYLQAFFNALDGVMTAAEEGE